MRAFTKLSDEPIGDRSAVAKADYVIYLDDTLLGEGWETELKPGGVVLVNSVRMFDDERIAALDADGISAAVLGRPIPNTVFLGRPVGAVRSGERRERAGSHPPVHAGEAAREEHRHRWTLHGRRWAKSRRSAKSKEPMQRQLKALRV